MNQQNDDKCTIAANTPLELSGIFPDYATHSNSLKNYCKPLFKSIHPGNCQLMKNFPGLKGATDLPESVKKLMGESTPVNWPGVFNPCSE
jgi:hypothetical protein